MVNQRPGKGSQIRLQQGRERVRTNFAQLNFRHILNFTLILKKKFRKEHFVVTIREFGLFEVFSQKTITVELFIGYYQTLTENTIRSNFDGEYFSKVD